MFSLRTYGYGWGKTRENARGKTIFGWPLTKWRSFSRRWMGRSLSQPDLFWPFFVVSPSMDGAPVGQRLLGSSVVTVGGCCFVFCLRWTMATPALCAAAPVNHLEESASSTLPLNSTRLIPTSSDEQKSAWQQNVTVLKWQNSLFSATHSSYKPTSRHGRKYEPAWI